MEGTERLAKKSSDHRVAPQPRSEAFLRRLLNKMLQDAAGAVCKGPSEGKVFGNHMAHMALQSCGTRGMPVRPRALKTPARERIPFQDYAVVLDSRAEALASTERRRSCDEFANDCAWRDLRYDAF